MTKELLLFTTPYCSVCPQMKQRVKRVLENKTDITYKEIDATTEEGRPLSQQYRVMSAPVVIYLEDGVQIGYLNGLKNEDEIENMIKGEN